MMIPPPEEDEPPSRVHERLFISSIRDREIADKLEDDSKELRRSVLVLGAVAVAYELVHYGPKLAEYVSEILKY